MIISNYIVTQETCQSTQGITDNGGTNVPHVHRFGNIRSGEVDDNCLRLFHKCYAEALIAKHFLSKCCKIGRLDTEIDETRAGNLKCSYLRITKVFDYLCC